MKLPSIFTIAGVTLLAGAVLLFTPHPARAIFQLVPPSFEISANPGDSVSKTIKLYNLDQAPTVLFASTATFDTKDEAGDPNFTISTTPTDLASWIDYPAGPLAIPANGTITVKITINIPKTAEPGGHYASVFFGTDQALKQAGSGVAIKSLTGPLVILTVSGNIRESASLIQVGLDGGNSMTNRLPATLFARLQNSGNVHVRPEGNVTVKNMFGQQSAVLKFNDIANGAILPNSIRRFDVVWGKTTDSAKRGNFFQEIGNEWRNFALGTYTATFDLTYGQKHTPLTATMKFTVLPWRLLLVELIILVIIVAGFIIGIKRYNSTIVRHALAQKTPPTGKVK